MSMAKDHQKMISGGDAGAASDGREKGGVVVVMLQECRLCRGGGAEGD